jgi:hypothetical protein
MHNQAVRFTIYLLSSDKASQLLVALEAKPELGVDGKMKDQGRAPYLRGGIVHLIASIFINNFNIIDVKQMSRAGEEVGIQLAGAPTFSL